MASTGLNIWSNSGNWLTDAASWSLGAPPTASNDVLISTGAAATLTGAGVASTIYINPYGAIYVTSGGSLRAVNINVSGSGSLNVAAGGGDGADPVTLTGTLTNAGQVTLGNGALSASTTFITAKVTNSGTISLYGNETAGTANQATLKVGSAAPTILTGSWLVHGDAQVQFASGSVTGIGSSGSVQLYGQQAGFSTATGSLNSALGALSSNYGVFDEEGDSSYGSGGASVATTASFMNGGKLQLDIYGGDGASQLTIGGVLTNTGTIAIGNSTLSADTSVTVGELNNLGTINLYGNDTLGTTDQATLDILSAAPATITGFVSAHGDALVEFASGGVQSIGVGAELQIVGQQARFAIGGGATNSALNALASNYGVFDEEGGSSIGPGGAVVSTSAAFTNAASFDLDILGGDGGSRFTDANTFTNNGSVQIGNSSLSANTTLTVNALVNYGSVYVVSQATAGVGIPLAELNILSAAPSSATGSLHVAGDSLVSFTGTASIQSIAAGASIELDGGAASIANASGGYNSALKGLNSNSGTLLLRGGNGLGSGAAVTTTAAFLNADLVEIDVFGGDGGSSLHIGGALANAGVFDIGNTSLSTATTVTATSLANTGTLNVFGGIAGTASPVAKLAISGASPTAVTNNIRVLGAGAITFGSGAGFRSIVAGGALELDGGQANISVGAGGQNSGLAALASNAGSFVLRGDVYGVGGVKVTTTGGYANLGTTSIDYYGGDGGSTFNIGGVLSNASNLYIGNQSLSAATTVNALSLQNAGNLTLQGGTGDSTTPKATLAISGAAVAAVGSYNRVGGNATLSYGSGAGYTSISSGGWLELDGALANIKAGASGAQNSGVSSLALNSGVFVLQGNQYGAGGASVTTTTGFTNKGTTYIDAYSSADYGSTFNIGGALNNAKTFYIGNGSLAGATLVTAQSLNDTGTLLVQGAASGNAVATLDIAAAALPSLAGQMRVAGEGKIDFGSGSGITSIASTGWLELDSGFADIAIGAGSRNSAIAHLASNSGVFALRGGQYGSGGVNVATANAYVNNGTTYIDAYSSGDGGSNFNIGGALNNAGTFNIGNTSLSAATNVTAASLVNLGALNVFGSTSGSGAPVAELAIAAAAPRTVTNNIRVLGTGVINFGSGTGFGAVGSGATLELDGGQANISIGAGNQNSGLANLASNAGYLVLRGDAYGVGGVGVKTNGAFTNQGTTYIDYYNGDGGSTFNVGGVLANTHNLYIGNQYLAGATTVEATALNNTGSLTLQGNAGNSTSASATLAISGAAVAAVASYTRVSGNATLSYGSGLGYTSISSAGWLELDGEYANIQAGATGTQNSGVGSLMSNSGTFVLRGNQYGVGGVTVSTNADFSNRGTVYIDAYGGGDGGSTFNVGGALNNAKTFYIGNANMSSATLVTAQSLNEAGTLFVEGNTSGGATATLAIAGSAAATLLGEIRIAGEGQVEFGSGTGIGVIASTGWVELDGGYANLGIALGSQNSALAHLTGNAGTFVLRGGYLGSGGVNVAISGAFTNTGTTYVDAYGNGEGGSSLTVQGLLANQGVLDIGNQYMSSASSVIANQLTNAGKLTISGSYASGGPGATLNVTQASLGYVAGYIRLDGVATLNFGVGNGLTSILAGGQLEIDSSLASVTVGGGAQNSGLSKLATNGGTLLLRGDVYGPGGVDITTSLGFTNTGTVDVDIYSGDGGSLFAIGGTLTNQGAFNLGGGGQAAAAAVTAVNLVNAAGQISISGSGTTSTMSVSGAAANYANVAVNAGGALAVAGAYTQYAGRTIVNGTLSASSYTQYDGATTVGLSGAIDTATLNARGGLIDFQGALTATSGPTTLNVQSGAAIEFDAAVSAAQSVTFQGPNGTIDFGSSATGAFDATINGFAAGDAIDLLQQQATSLSYAGGVLDVFNGTTEIAALQLAGTYTPSSFALVSDNNYGMKIIM